MKRPDSGPVSNLDGEREFSNENVKSFCDVAGLNV
jgi:hypothetical protein